MPKKKIHLKLVAYEKDNVSSSELDLSAYSYDRIFEIYMEFAKLLLEGQFTYYYRFDLVGSNRVLFSCCSLRSFVDQKNLTINFNPY